MILTSLANSVGHEGLRLKSNKYWQELQNCHRYREPFPEGRETKRQKKSNGLLKHLCKGTLNKHVIVQQR